METDDVLNGIEVLIDADMGTERIEGDLIAELKRLGVLKRSVDEVENNLKTLKKEYGDIERKACKLMRQDDIDSIRVAGIEFSPMLSEYKILGDKVKAFEWLETEGFGSAIKMSEPTIHHKTLGKLMRERIEIHGIESVPAELIGCSTINRLSIREKEKKS